MGERGPRLSSLVILERDGSVAKILLNRPEAFNAFGLDMMSELQDILIDLTSDEAVRAVVLSGAGKAFCAGGDIAWMDSFPAGPPAGIHLLAARFHVAVGEIRRMRKPVIAAINGAAAGGGFSLALACDFRVMERSAKLRQAYTSSGLSMDGGGSFMLPRLVGLARALEIAAFDAPIDAEKALAWGLATSLCGDGKSVDEAMSIAHVLAERSNSAFGMVKQLMTDAFDASWERHLEKEREGIAWSSGQPDGQEGIAAFLAKRKPVFGPN